MLIRTQFKCIVLMWSPLSSCGSSSLSMSVTDWTVKYFVNDSVPFFHAAVVVIARCRRCCLGISYMQGLPCPLPQPEFRLLFVFYGWSSSKCLGSLGVGAVDSWCRCQTKTCLDGDEMHGIDDMRTRLFYQVVLVMEIWARKKGITLRSSGTLDFRPGTRAHTKKSKQH